MNRSLLAFASLLIAPAALRAQTAPASVVPPVPLRVYLHDQDGGGRDFSGTMTVPSNTRVHNYHFVDSTDPVRIADGATNVQIDHNTFTQIKGTGIYGYPGDNLIVEYNAFDYVYEPVHLFAGRGSSHTSVSYNAITHATRIGIEMQNPFNHLRVNGNRITDWLRNPGDSPQDLANPNADSHMALSIATGGWWFNDPNNPTPGTTFPGGRHQEIAYNVLLANGPQQQLNSWAKFAIEVMAGDVSLHDNYIAQGWGGGFLLGNDGDAYTQNNVFIGCTNYGPYAEGDRTPWPVPPIKKLGGDQEFKQPNDPAAPPVPRQQSGEAGPAPIDLTPVITTAPASQPADTALTPTTQPASAPTRVVAHTVTVYTDGSVSVDESPATGR